MQNKINAFQKNFPCIHCEREFDFSKHTTIGVGGKAMLAVYPKNMLELQQVLKYCLEQNIPYYPLGKGANVLASDNTFQGIVIQLIHLNTYYLENNFIYAEAGVSLAQLVNFAKINGIGGFVPLLGFPATLGGAIYMNAGTQKGYIASLIDNVTILDENLQYKTLMHQDCQFSYKHSIFMKNRAIILSAKLQAKRACIEEVEAEMLQRKEARKNLPIGKSMGCVFKNFIDCTAGELIDAAGCKGMQIGEAVVSRQHANFIMNIGNAKAIDVKNLIENVKECVYQKFQRILIEEIEYIGEF